MRNCIFLRCAFALSLLFFIAERIHAWPDVSRLSVDAAVPPMREASANLLVNPDFENGLAGWTEYSSGGYPIVINRSTITPHSGRWYAWMGDYNEASEYIYQDVIIPANAVEANFQFWYRVITQETDSDVFDTMTVEVRIPGSEVLLANPATLTNMDDSEEWVQSPEFDLLEFKGQTIRLSFNVSTDFNKPTSFLVDDVSLMTASCSYSLATNSASFGSAGGTGSVGITTGDECDWTVVNDSSWVTITSGNGGGGSGTVSYSVAANAGSARTGTMTIAGQTFTVTQEAGAAEIALLAPNGGEYIPSGSTFTVEWRAPSEAETFTLLYSIDGGETWKVIAQDVRGTSHPWGVPILRRNNKGCLVGVIGYSGPEMKIGEDVSDGPFSIDVLEVAAPNGGEIIPSGTEYPITWRASSEASSFTVKYSMDSGATWQIIAPDVTGTSYPWNVPTPTSNKKRCFVKVIGYKVTRDKRKVKVSEDRSDKTFVIEGVRVDSPNGNENLISGKRTQITWITNGTETSVFSVFLYYTKDGGSTWNWINTLPTNTGTYDWDIPRILGLGPKKKCKVKVVLKNFEGKILGSDASDSYFWIWPPVQ